MPVLRILKSCAHCGAEFSVPPSLSAVEHCSTACANAAQAVGQQAKTCLACGKEFTHSPSKSDRKYCSKECAGIGRRNRPHPIGTYFDKTCPVCDKAFRVPPSNQHVICCSMECHRERVRGRPRHYTEDSKARLTGRPKRSVDETRSCPVCGTEFTVPSYNPKKFCSRACYWETRKDLDVVGGLIEKTCPVCGNTFRVYPSQQDTACCSRRCAGIRKSSMAAEEVRHLTHPDAKWLAGVFDGEGSIILSQRSRAAGAVPGYVRITLTNTVRPLTEKVREVTGVGGITVWRRSEVNPRHQDQYTWQVGGGRALEILRQIRPWLIAKAERADAVLAGEPFPRQSRWDHIYPPGEPAEDEPQTAALF